MLKFFSNLFKQYLLLTNAFENQRVKYFHIKSRLL